MSVVTWANGFGVWHARVPRAAASPLIAARGALRDELIARENNVAREVWANPVRVPDLDDDATVVYRERFIPEEADSAGDATRQRLEYLRGEIRAERISMGELIELQGLAEHITPGDTELLEWAGVPEFPETVKEG